MRHVHLVGSIPAASTAEALDLVKKYVGPQLGSCVSDGETGDRSGWMIHIYEAQRRLPQLRVVKEGDFSSWEMTPLLGVRPGHQFHEADLSRLSLDVMDSFPAFSRLKLEIRRNDLAFMVGIPSPLSLSYQIFGSDPGQWKPNVAAFQRATVKQIAKISRETTGQVVFQIEIPIEMVLLISEPPTMWERTAANSIAHLHSLVAECAPGTRFGVHLCWGDLKWATDKVPPDAEPIVVMGNAIAMGWPVERRLEYIHAPFVVGTADPPTAPAYYRPLARLNIDPNTSFIAGYIDERLTTGQLLRIRNEIETLMNREIDVASTCGLGRRPVAKAIQHMELASIVARAP
jgi:hypothetical protein